MTTPLTNYLMRSLLRLLLVLLSAAGVIAQQPCGDCTLDGAVNVLDAFTAAKADAGLGPLSGLAFERCNVAGVLGGAATPGTAIDVTDALLIAQYVVRLRSTLHCGSGAPIWDLREVPVDIVPNEVWSSFPLDIDGDGCMDWVEVDGQGPARDGTVRVWRSLCDGTAQQVAVILTGLLRGNFAAVGDLDGDGDTDFAVTGTAVAPYPPIHHEIVVYANDGLGNFSELTRMNQLGVSQFLWIAQMNGDAIPDLVVSPWDGLSGFWWLDVYLGQGGGQFDPPVTIPLGDMVAGVRRVYDLVDLDHDGFADLLGRSYAYSYPHLDPHMFVRWNDGTGVGFQEQILPQQPPVLPPNGDPVGVRAHDVDGDGTLDLLSEWVNNPGPPPVVLDYYFTRGLGGRAFSGLEFIAGGLGQTALRNSRGIADFDGDGYLDVACHLLSGDIEFHSYKPSGWIGPVLTLQVGSMSADGLALDLDGDGDMDFMANTAPPLRPTRIWLNHRW